MKRITILFECSCSLTLWAEGGELRAAEHHCEDHQSDEPPGLLPDWRAMEGKKIATVSIERAGR